jgi:hypothetical protein
MAIILKANKVNLFVFWYHSRNVLDTPRIIAMHYRWPDTQHTVLNINMYGDTVNLTSSVPRIFSGEGGVQQIQLMTEGRENGVLGAVTP